MSTTVTSDLPVVAERAMYWPGGATSWYEAHNSFGITSVGTKWGLSEGRVGQAQGFETFILLANATTTAAEVKATFLRTDGTTVVKNYTVQPKTRFTIYVNSMVPELTNETFGALIEVTNGVGIFVERALYWNAVGRRVGGGHERARHAAAVVGRIVETSVRSAAGDGARMRASPAVCFCLPAWSGAGRPGPCRS